MRIGKHRGCGGEFIATEISNDNITEVTCKKCKQSFLANIVPKRKQKVIAEFERAINNI